MSEEGDDCCAPISYVYGGISLSPKPPGQFLVGVRVSVGVQIAPLTGPELGDNHALWHFLAVVKPGPIKVVCTIGDVTSIKNVETRPGETSIVNFCFGRPVVSSNVRGLPKIKSRRKERSNRLLENGLVGKAGGKPSQDLPLPPADSK